MNVVRRKAQGTGRKGKKNYDNHKPFALCLICHICIYQGAGLTEQGARET
jgi:hypothetical protein